MCLEVAIVLVFDVPLIWTGGPRGWQFYSFSPSAFVSGPVGLAILFASATFMGFEGTAIYRSEVKNPQKTIPRATYLAISLIGVFYVLTAWALVTFYGVDAIKPAAAGNPSGLFADGIAHYAGALVAQGMLCLVCTSLFAATLSAHNPMARYTFALARDGIYPSILARVHTKHRSPAVASAVTSIIAAAILLPFAVVGTNPVIFYSWMFAIGTYALLLCMALTCLAVIVYFRRVKRGEHLWNITIAPSLGLIGLTVVLGISSYYFPLLINNDKVLALVFQGFIAGLLILGVILALIWRRTRPAVYARIGGESDAP
jgi:amino acid transporter